MQWGVLLQWCNGICPNSLNFEPLSHTVNILRSINIHYFSIVSLFLVSAGMNVTYRGCYRTPENGTQIFPASILNLTTEICSEFCSSKVSRLYTMTSYPIVLMLCSLISYFYISVFIVILTRCFFFIRSREALETLFFLLLQMPTINRFTLFAH